MEVSEVLCMKLVRDTQTGKVAAPASGPREPRWLDALERDATVPKLNSYLLGNRSSRCCSPRTTGHGHELPRAAMNSRGERYPSALCG
jgi:hypothetical protein